MHGRRNQKPEVIGENPPAPASTRHPIQSLLKQCKRVMKALAYLTLSAKRFGQVFEDLSFDTLLHGTQQPSQLDPDAHRRLLDIDASADTRAFEAKALAFPVILDREALIYPRCDVFCERSRLFRTQWVLVPNVDVGQKRTLQAFRVAYKRARGEASTDFSSVDSAKN